MNSILNGLNDKQKIAAETIDGPLLILAGAGSGKTRTLTYRIAHMILEKKISPYSILGVTFTNKAAKEMKERVEDLIGVDGQRVVLSTFHSFGVKLLRMYGRELGYESNFNIYDGDDQKRLAKEIMKEIGINDKNTTPAKVVSIISKLKEEGITPEDYKNDSRGFLENYKIVSAVYDRYQKALRKNNAMDFSDLLINTRELLNIKDILDKIQDRYKYIMVDEYQDTNQIQYDIINKIASKEQNLCVVGDEDQSIYGFRGANIKNILDFEKDYKDAKVVKLEQNYRSTENILEAANGIIKNNTTSRGKNLWTATKGGSKVRVFQGDDGWDEAYKTTGIINDLIKKGYSYKDITILYRTNAQSRTFEEIFVRFNIPYKIFGGLQFYQRMEIKDIIAYMNLISNPKDDLSFTRIINVPKRKIGAKTIETIRTFSEREGISLLESLGRIEEIGLGPSVRVTLMDFYEKIRKLQEEIEFIEVGEVMDEILTTFSYKNYIENLDDKWETRLENIEEFKSAINEMDEGNGGITLGEFLETIALVSATDKLGEDDDYIKLMTIHNSKGLEFKVVFFVGVEDEYLPGRAEPGSGDEEEERRLCYVAITRAEKELYISYTQNRMIYGTTMVRRPSRFIDEVDENLLEYLGNEKRVEKSKKKEGVTRFSNGKKIENITTSKLKGDKVETPFKLGERVINKKFGLGIIKDINVKTIEVEFVSGRKKFLTSVAEKFITKES